MAFPPKISPGAVDRVAEAFAGALPGRCVCGHSKAEHAAGSGECMAVGGTRGPKLAFSDRMKVACPCHGYLAPRAPDPPAPAPRGWLSRGLEGLGVASEMARAVFGVAQGELARWRASRRASRAGAASVRPGVGPCSREPPHVCGVNGPCNGYPRP